MRIDDIPQLKEAVRKPAAPAGASAFGQMANTLGGANRTKSSTGGTTTRTQTGLTHTANPGNPNNHPVKHPSPSTSNTTEITKEWIQYLKNVRIIEMNPDPKTGAVIYRRTPTTYDLSKFLLAKTDYDKETISNAIQSVMYSNAKTTPLTNKRTGGKVAGQISQTPTAIRKRNARAANKQPQTNTLVTEAILDTPTEIHEKDVEAIFSQLLSHGLTDVTPQANTVPNSTTPADSQEAAPEDTQTKFKNIKRLIRDQMNPMQRKSLWRALNESLLYEAEIQPADVKALFRDAYKLRDATNSGIRGKLNTGIGKIHKGLRKDKVDINDLQQAWKDAGYPDDTRDIYQILKTQGFGNSEINKIFSNTFSNTFGDDTNHETEVASPAAAKIANYVEKNGLKDELIKFMQQEYGEELGITKDRGLLGKVVDFGKNMFKKKATVEEVRQVFATIVHEERTDREVLIRQEDRELLGRFRK